MDNIGFQGSIFIEDNIVTINEKMDYSSNNDVIYTRPSNILGGFSETIDFLLVDENDNSLSNQSTLTIKICGVGCVCNGDISKCDDCYSDFYFINVKREYCTPESEFLQEYPWRNRFL